MIPGKGQFRRLVERNSERFDIIVDGRKVEVCKGDLAITSILLSQGAVRRFEFGDSYRAGFCLMSACQDCWVTLGDGRRVRSCDTVVEPGMVIQTGVFNPEYNGMRDG